MKTLKKLSALLLSSALAISAMPLTAVAAEGETEEPLQVDATIQMDGTTVTANGEHVTVDGTKITIDHSGAYVFSGALEDGQIIVNIPDEKTDAETVKLYFNGVKITGKNAAAVYVINAENTSINLEAGTENFLYDESFYDETATGTTAVIYAKDDITIKGEGSLRVESKYNYGLHCNNDVKITGGNIKFKVEGTPSDTSASAEKRADAVRGKTSVTVKGGEIDINAEGDGIKSTKGDVFFQDGKAEIKAGNDAVQGETVVQISGGSLKANGDRSVTCSSGKISISGGSVCGTSTDPNPTNLEVTQPTMLFALTEEVAKDHGILLSIIETVATENVTTSSTKSVLGFNPDKKFSNILLSDPALNAGTNYQLAIGGYAATTADGEIFTAAEAVASFENVNPNQPAETGETTTVAPATDPASDTTAAPAEYAKGDINGDGKVTISDAVLLARIIAEDSTLDLKNNETSRADIDGSSLIDSDDLTYLLKSLAGLV